MTASEMLATVKRELEYRKVVYPKLHTEGKMAYTDYMKEIKSMEFIVAHFTELAKTEAPVLPGMDYKSVSCPSCGCKFKV